VREHNEDIDVIYFPGKFFQSRQHFASLLLMEDFYDRFNWCDFLLVHELNSWIVRDELFYWCKQGYDYLKSGPVYDAFPESKDGVITRTLGLNDEQKRLFGSGYNDNGIYLCQIERMTNTLKAKRKEAYQYRHDEELPNADSLFWDIEANRFWPYLRKPTTTVRNYFAQNAVNLNERKTITVCIDRHNPGKYSLFALF
jgi:hypothetical protein